MATICASADALAGFVLVTLFVDRGVAGRTYPVPGAITAFSGARSARGLWSVTIGPPVPADAPGCPI